MKMFSLLHISHKELGTAHGPATGVLEYEEFDLILVCKIESHCVA